MPKIKSVRMTICKSLPYTGTREKLQHFSHCIPNADLQTTRTACPLEGVRIQMSWSYFLYCFHIPSNIIKKHGSSVCVLLPGPMHRGDSATAQLWKKTAQFKSIKLTNCHLLYFLYCFFSCLRFLFVCRTGDLVLISPHFLALGCQLPVLHHDDKSHRYQTTSPSLGGSPGPGSSRPRSQRLQPTSNQRQLQPLAEANLRQTPQSSHFAKAQPSKWNSHLWERPSCPGGTRQGWHGGKQTPKNRTPRNTSALTGHITRVHTPAGPT